VHLQAQCPPAYLVASPWFVDDGVIAAETASAAWVSGFGTEVTAKRDDGMTIDRT